MSTYKELVDDIQIQFKIHNESVKTQNPYWILFRLITEINSIRDELLQKLPDAESVPEWILTTSPFIEGTLSNSGNVAGVFDDFKFSLFMLPEAYPIFSTKGIITVHPMMKQKSVFIEPKDTVFLRIQSDDENLLHYHYGFIVNAKLFVYPMMDRLYVRYVPTTFGGDYSTLVVTTKIPAPDFIVSEARKRVLESVIIQKQIPEDDKPDGRDRPDIGSANQNR